MSTTKSNFIRFKNPALVGTNVVSGNAIAVCDPASALVHESNGGAVRIDRKVVDLSLAGYAKNGAFELTLVASTPVTVDVTNTAGAATNVAGDTGYTAINEIIFDNFGNQDVIVGAAGSNPFLGPLGGTTPTITIPAKSSHRIQSVAGWTVGTAKNLKFDPGSSPATIAVAIGGA